MHYGNCDGCRALVRVNRSDGGGHRKRLTPPGNYCDHCFNEFGLDRRGDTKLRSRRPSSIRDEDPYQQYALRCWEDAPE